MISPNTQHSTPFSAEPHTPVLSTLTPYQAVTMIDNLQQQLHIYRNVQDLLLQKKVSLLKQSVMDLPAQDKVLKKLRKQLDALEEGRMEMLKEFWPLALEPVHATMILLAMPTDQKEAFNLVRNDLKVTLTQVAHLQEETQRLLHASLDWVNQGMAWVKQHIQSGQKELTYTAQGKTKKNQSISTMQRQV
ncbi:MAG: flagellar protein FlgN [Vampirovibrionales bacterium]